jgi:hypothetical protein
MPWNLGLVSERVADAPPGGTFPSFTDFTGLSALPAGWSQVSGGTLQFFVDGMGVSTGALGIEKTTTASDFSINGGGYMLFHIKRGSPTGGSTGSQAARYITNPVVTENLTGIPGYSTTGPVYGNGFFRNDTVPGSEQTTAITSPVATGVQDLWMAGVRPPTGPSRFYIANGVSGVFQVVTGGTGGLAPVTKERVEIFNTGTDIRICQTLMNYGTLTITQVVQEWRTFMDYP